MIYISILLISIIFSIPLNSNGIKENAIISKFIIVTISLFLSSLFLFRSNAVGTDTLNYFEIYESSALISSFAELALYSSNSGIEIGYLFLCKIASFFFSFSLFSFFVMFFSYYFLLNFIKNKNYNFTVILSGILILSGYYLFSFNILRQFLGMISFLCAIDLFCKKKYKSWIFLIIFSISIHYSAVIGLFIPLFFIFRSVIKKYLLLILFIIVFSIDFFQRYLIISNDRYINYVGNDGDGYSFNVLFLIAYTIIFICSYFTKNIKEKDEMYYLYLFLSGLFIVMQFYSKIFGIYNQGFSRVMLYFSWSLIFLLNSFDRFFKSEGARFVYNFSLVFIMISYFGFIVMRGIPDITPFLFAW